MSRRLTAVAVAVSLVCALPGPADAADVKALLMAKAKEQFFAKLEQSNPELAKTLKDAGESKWTGYAADIAKGDARKVVKDIFKSKTTELWKKGKQHAIDNGILGPDTKTYLGWVEKYQSELTDMATKTYQGDFRGAGNVLITRMKKEVGSNLKKQTVELIDFFMKDVIGQPVGARYLAFLEWEAKKIDEFEKYTISYFGKIPGVKGDSRVERTWCEQYLAMRKAGHDAHSAFYGQDDSTGVPLSIADLVNVGGYWYSTSRGVLSASERKARRLPAEDQLGARPDEATMRKQLELCELRQRAPNLAEVQRRVDDARRITDTELFGTIQEGMEEEERQIVVIIDREWPSLPDDFTFVVTVVASDTGKKVTGAKVTLDGETKDAPQGEVSYARKLDMLLVEKAAESIDVSAEAKGFATKTMSLNIGTLSNRFNVDKRQVALQVSLAPDQQPSDIDVAVAVVDKKSGKAISGAKATFDGETKDAANGVATFQRKSDKLDPAGGERTITVQADAPDHEPGSLSHTLTELAGKIDANRKRLDLKVELEPKEKKKPSDDVVKLVVDCDPAEIFADETSTCTATAHLKSGTTKDVTADASWNPPAVERSKGAVTGADFVPAHAPPHTVTVEATWQAPPEHGGKSVLDRDSVLVKARAGNATPGIKVLVTPSATLVPKGDAVAYAYRLVNTGNAPLSKVALQDDECSPITPSGGDANGDGKLDPGESWDYACDMQIDADTTSTITATGSAPDGTRVTDATKVDVKIGRPPCPPPKVRVPDVRGTMEPAAITQLHGESLNGNVVARQLDDTTKEGTVLDQDPRHPACVDPRSIVELWVSKGPQDDDDKNDDDEPTDEPGKDDPAGNGPLGFDLDCGPSFEIAQGDFLGRTCQITVRGWRSNTEDRVSVTIEYQRDTSGIEVSPGDTSAPPSLMYVPYTHDTYGRYVFSETFRATDDAPTGTTTVAISVSQPGRTTVTRLVRVAVIRKGLLPSDGPGIRPPADVKTGSGGEYCVWRHKLVGDPAPCFHFVAAGCDNARYTNPRNGYELVGSKMTWGEADERVEDLSSYFDDTYGCRAAGGGITDTDGDGKGDNEDGCPTNPEKQAPGECGCGLPDTDSDGDGTADCNDGCADDPDKTEAGECGCGVSDKDSDGDGTMNCRDNCPEDSNKTEPGICDCGYSDDDTDRDGTIDCKDECPRDADKVREGYCGCGKDEKDSDRDAFPDCIDACPKDPDRTDRPCADGGNPAADDDDDEGDDDRRPIDPGIGDRFRDREREREGRQEGQRTTDVLKPPKRGGDDIDDEIDDLIEEAKKDDRPPHTPRRPPTRPAPPPPQAPAGPTTPPVANEPPGGSGLTNVTVGVTPTDMYVWDHGTEDLDRVDIFLNGQLVQGNMTLRNAKQKIVLQLKAGPNTLTVRALNIGDPQMQIDLGLPPYNAAAIEIQGVKVGNASQSWELSQGQTGSMTITYTP